MVDQSLEGEGLVFVYGTLKRGGRLNVVLRELKAEYVGEGLVKGYTLREMNDGQFPAAVPANALETVLGELWRLPHQHTGLWVLDRYEGVPMLYVRREVDVIEIVPVTVENEGEYHTRATHRAAMYVLNHRNLRVAGPIIGSYFEADATSRSL